MKAKLNKTWFGILSGMVALVIGLIITCASWTGLSSAGISAFLDQLASSVDYRTNVLLFSIIPIPVLFFIYNRIDLDRAANGVVGFSMILAIYIVAANVL